MKALYERKSFVTHLHRDIDDAFDPALIHHLQDSSRVLRIKMVVVVDSGKFRPLQVMHGRDQHRTRLKITERKIDLRLRGHHRDELVPVSSRLTHGRASPAPPAG